jgi:hypothetical protein
MFEKFDQAASDAALAEKFLATTAGAARINIAIENTQHPKRTAKEWSQVMSDSSVNPRARTQPQGYAPNSLFVFGRYLSDADTRTKGTSKIGKKAATYPLTVQIDAARRLVNRKGKTLDDADRESWLTRATLALSK